MKKAGDFIIYYEVMDKDKPVSDGMLYKIVEIFPNGIPSFPKPMAKLSGKPGLVNLTHCFTQVQVLDFIREKL